MSAEHFPRLRKSHLFAGVDDASLRTIAESFSRLDLSPDEVVFKERDHSDSFYIIYRGKVVITRRKDKADLVLATLEDGDYFGEMGLAASRRRNATAKAKTAVTLLCLPSKEFHRLLQRFPRVKSNLEISLHSRGLVRQHGFKWLSEGEVIYLVTQKHRIRLYQMLALPVLAAIVLLGAGIGASSLNYWNAWAVLGPSLAAALLWIAWNYIDWGNDYYILTNRRIVFLEKIVGIYDSRTEAPLWSIRAVRVSTTAAGRVLNYGDVTIQTISSPIVFENVPGPQQMADVIQEHWDRAKTRQAVGDTEALKATIRGKVFPDSAAPTPAAPGPPTPVVSVSTVKPWVSRVAPTSSLQVRFEQGDAVTYRKHWIVLLRAIGWPSIGLMFLAGLAGLELTGQINPSLSYGLLCGEAVAALPILGWWWYQFEDWSNDIYQLTKDQIVDRAKKPLGAETRKVAPLDNILSAKLDRKGVWALVFNYGDVIIQTGGAAGEMRFENVFDPVGVQQDVYRRLEAYQAAKGRAEAQRRRDEAAEWLNAYHQVSAEYQEQLRRQQEEMGDE